MIKQVLLAQNMRHQINPHQVFCHWLINDLMINKLKIRNKFLTLNVVRHHRSGEVTAGSNTLSNFSGEVAIRLVAAWVINMNMWLRSESCLYLYCDRIALPSRSIKCHSSSLWQRSSFFMSSVLALTRNQTHINHSPTIAITLHSHTKMLHIKKIHLVIIKENKYHLTHAQADEGTFFVSNVINYINLCTTWQVICWHCLNKFTTNIFISILSCQLTTGRYSIDILAWGQTGDRPFAFILTVQSTIRFTLHRDVDFSQVVFSTVYRQNSNFTNVCS